MNILVFVIGLCFGSFVNMLVWRRINIDKKIKSDLSICDYCGKRLNWWNNIPVLSFLFQRGKSQCCGKKLDWSYPLVELLTGFLFLTNYCLSANDYFTMIIVMVIIVLIVYSAVYDAKTMYIPDESIYPLILLGLFFARDINSINHINSAIGASLFLYLLSLVKIRGKEGMGMGDVFLAIFMGLFLGYPNIIVAFYLAFIVGAIWGIFYLWILRKKKKETMVSFGPFLLGGTLVAWWWGEGLWYYFSNLIIR
jgi:leader peptidase (prepilin peptidase)/N-methyltransferase